jgi:sugar/nucleoside kinase (ribokinase family)
VPVLLDVGRAQPGIEDLLDLTDYVLCDARFPAEYLGEGDPSRSLRAIAERHRTPLVAMTLGARGSLAWVDGRAVATPAFAVDVADTTGAGDVWHAGFAAGLLWDLPLEEILRVAAGAAAMSCTKVGGRAGAPTRAELETFLRTARTC